MSQKHISEKLAYVTCWDDGFKIIRYNNNEYLWVIHMDSNIIDVYIDYKGLISNRFICCTQIFKS